MLSSHPSQEEFIILIWLPNNYSENCCNFNFTGYDWDRELTNRIGPQVSYLVRQRTSPIGIQKDYLTALTGLFNAAFDGLFDGTNTAFDGLQIT